MTGKFKVSSALLRYVSDASKIRSFDIFLLITVAGENEEKKSKEAS